MRREPRSVRVEIELVDGVHLRCTPDPVYVAPRDTIEWRSPGESTHEVLFRGRSPLVGPSSRLEGQGATKGTVANIIGSFKYEVSLRVPEDDVEYFVDPTVIVER
jgi:plastocyanin